MGNSKPSKQHQIWENHFTFQLMVFTRNNLKVNLQGINFQQSSYNILSPNNSRVEKFDKQIRNSQYSFVQNQQLSSISDDFIKDYLRITRCKHPYFYRPLNEKWRIIKYNQNGHFKRHSDREKFKEDYVHFGTQIFIPPLSQVNFEGGQLYLFKNGRTESIRPDGKKWTHLIIPLGNDHEVKNVTKGFRITYVRQIWFREEQFSIRTDLDKMRQHRNDQIQSYNREIQLQQQPSDRFKHYRGNYRGWDQRFFFTD